MDIKKAMGWPLVIIVVLLLVVGSWWYFFSEPLIFDAGTYQAVFLSNNQVYFGKLAPAGKNFVKLTDIFYLQVAQPLQPSGPASNINLIKLGNELHGPADAMQINRDHILFIEDLKSDSQVVQAIG